MVSSSPVSMHGSPPRVWGHLPPLRFTRQSHRFTPTRVGTSGAMCRCWPCGAVHPHACGDIKLVYHGSDDKFGSPPRVWGHRVCPLHRARRARFTPTRVGTSRARFSATRPRTVHPHACGDISRKHIGCSDLSGSPPRVWGHHKAADSVRAALRFTPTRVGTSPTPSGSLSVSSVHPHACGDICRLSQHSCAGCFRFTPTRVGTSHK